MRAPSLRLVLLAVLVAIGLAPRGASAHAEPYSWITVWIRDGALHGQVTAHVFDIAQAIDVARPESLLVPAFTARECERIQNAIDGLFHLDLDGNPAVPEWRSCTVVPDRHGITLEFDIKNARPAQLVLHGPLFAYDPAHETYFNVYLGEQLVHQDLLDFGRTASPFATGLLQTTGEVIRRFLDEGVHRVLRRPEQLLFVAGLLLLGGSLKRQLAIVGVFMVAHSFTLTLATLGAIQLPVRIIDPIVALSVVYIGADNLLRSRRGEAPAGSAAVGSAGPRFAIDPQLWIAGAFGLAHGFGLTNVLRELGPSHQALGSSLLWFNAGVEVGQAYVFWPVLLLFAVLHSRAPRVAPRVAILCSTALVAAGAYLFVQHTFLS